MGLFDGNLDAVVEEVAKEQEQRKQEKDANDYQAALANAKAGNGNSILIHSKSRPDVNFDASVELGRSPDSWWTSAWILSGKILEGEVAISESSPHAASPVQKGNTYGLISLALKTALDDKYGRDGHSIWHQDLTKKARTAREALSLMHITGLNTDNQLLEQIVTSLQTLSQSQKESDRLLARYLGQVTGAVLVKTNMVDDYHRDLIRNGTIQVPNLFKEGYTPHLELEHVLSLLGDKLNPPDKMSPDEAFESGYNFVGCHNRQDAYGVNAAKVSVDETGKNPFTFRLDSDYQRAASIAEKVAGGAATVSISPRDMGKLYAFIENACGWLATRKSKPESIEFQADQHVLTGAIAGAYLFDRLEGTKQFGKRKSLDETFINLVKDQRPELASSFKTELQKYAPKQVV